MKSWHPGWLEDSTTHHLALLEHLAIEPSGLSTLCGRKSWRCNHFWFLISYLKWLDARLHERECRKALHKLRAAIQTRGLSLTCSNVLGMLWFWARKLPSLKSPSFWEWGDSLRGGGFGAHHFHLRHSTCVSDRQRRLSHLRTDWKPLILLNLLLSEKHKPSPGRGSDFPTVT